MKLNNQFEQELFDLCPVDIKEIYLKDSFTLPSINHCIGTDKLLGQYYAPAICYKLGTTTKFVNKISSLSTLIRSYIVLDDFLKDNYISSDLSSSVRKLNENIMKKIQYLISSISSSTFANYLWNKYYGIYSNAYCNFSKHNIYDSIVSKCGIMLLPFEFEEIDNFEQSKKVKKIMQDYLFCLQLLDDFQDMEEDAISPKNHNIFLNLNNNLSYQMICNNRFKFHNIVFKIIITTLKKYTIYDNPIIHRYLINSIKWLEQRMIAYKINVKYNINDNIENFKLDLSFIDINNDTVNEYNYNEIKAENIHTIRS